MKPQNISDLLMLETKQNSLLNYTYKITNSLKNNSRGKVIREEKKNHSNKRLYIQVFTEKKTCSECKRR